MALPFYVLLTKTTFLFFCFLFLTHESVVVSIGTTPERLTLGVIGIVAACVGFFASYRHSKWILYVVVVLGLMLCVWHSISATPHYKRLIRRLKDSTDKANRGKNATVLNEEKRKRDLECKKNGKSNKCIKHLITFSVLHTTAAVFSILLTLFASAFALALDEDDY